MIRLNRKIEYAMVALKHLSCKKPNELTSAAEISEKFKTPFDATSRVLQIMAQRGLLRSEQGAHGGYKIAQDLEKVTLYDLSNMILGPVEIVKCLQDDQGHCELSSSCNIKTPAQNLNQKFVGFYKSIHLKELVAGYGR